MELEYTDKIKELSLKHPKPLKDHFSYGTAGFRMLSTRLDSVVFSVGLLAALRSKKLNKTIGVMITASHNPPEDNGVKIVDPLGEMLQESWEKYATAVANSTNLIETLNSIIQEENIDLSIKSKVVIGRDSRSSGLELTKSTIDGLKCFNTEFDDFGLLTTPQLHYLTRTFNDPTFGTKTEEGYYEKISKSFIQHYQVSQLNEKLAITVDAANGIGAEKVIKLQKYLDDYVEFKSVNDNYTEPSLLNVDCGADFVKTNQRLPAGVSDPESGKLYCSFDGDADRIVFYYVDTEGFHLLDGDKIATMLASFFASLLEPLSTDLKLGIVQTAYANGSSTKFITDVLKVPVDCTPTGVKHLHHRAQEYDVGVYFEANGHGTVLFSEKFIKFVKSADIDNVSAKVKENILKLRSLVDLINQTVGDAVSDLLTVLIVCADMKLTPKEWNDLYVDLPNKLAKVVVNDRNAFTTTDAERRLLTPKGLQDEIDSLVTNFPGGRSFVRASGTEDAVRVYAEAETIADCLELSLKVVDLVKKYA